MKQCFEDPQVRHLHFGGQERRELTHDKAPVLGEESFPRKRKRVIQSHRNHSKDQFDGFHKFGFNPEAANSHSPSGIDSGSPLPSWWRIIPLAISEVA